MRETIVKLADGCTLRSGLDTLPKDEYETGEYVRLCDSKGNELFYWDSEEWKEEPVLVMGAILKAAAGCRINVDHDIAEEDNK